MVLKMYEILELNRFYKNIRKLKLPIKTAHKLSKLASVIDKEISFYHEQCQAIIADYAQKDSNGGIAYVDDTKQGIKIEKGKESECEAKLKELSFLEVTIESPIMLKLEDFGAIELSVEDMIPIMPFIEE
jgi:hypothetical protein